jgi:type IV pilus assembly protein PilE
MRVDSYKQRNQNRGFTLIELMVTVAILAILAAIALPSYSDYVLRGRLVEAMSTLAGHRVKMEQFYQDNRTYVGACVAGTIAATPAATQNFTYACNIPDAQTYTVSATGQGSLSGFVYTIDQSNNQATTVSGGAASAGYSSSTTCWVRKKPNQC